MDISNIQGGANSNQTGITGAGNSELGQEEFLSLLVAQLQNQDPMNPQDGSEFAAELAQFNSVEQLINVNEGLKQLSEQQSSMSNAVTNTMAAQFAGKEVTAYTDRVVLSEDSGEVAINFRLNEPMEGGELMIRDENGNEVRTLEMGNYQAGDHEITWDGHDAQGNPVQPGNYSVEIQPEGDQEVSPITYLQGEAESVRYTGSGVQLMVDGISIPLADVEEIGKSSRD